MRQVTKINIFISSPADVLPERQAAIRVVERLNRMVSFREHFLLQPILYEDFPPMIGAGAQSTVNKYIDFESIHIFVSIFHDRMGTPFIDEKNKQRYQSGSEYEFIQAYENRRCHSLPHILLYRKKGKSEDTSQKHLVDKFFSQFEGENPIYQGLYKIFYATDEFEKQLFHDLEYILAGIPRLHGESISRRDHIEESRRIDAALPKELQLGHPTELWAQILLPESIGFRDILPAFTKLGDIITKQDVRASRMSTAFPIDPASGSVLPQLLQIHLNAPDFDIPEKMQLIELKSGQDSPLLLFHLIPRQTASTACVSVIIKSKSIEGEYWIVLGSISLHCSIVTAAQKNISKIFSLLSLNLSNQSNPSMDIGVRAEDLMPQVAAEKTSRQGLLYSKKVIDLSRYRVVLTRKQTQFWAILLFNPDDVSSEIDFCQIMKNEFMLYDEFCLITFLPVAEGLLHLSGNLDPIESDQELIKAYNNIFRRIVGRILNELGISSIRHAERLGLRQLPLPGLLFFKDLDSPPLRFMPFDGDIYIREICIKAESESKYDLPYVTLRQLLVPIFGGVDEDIHIQAGNFLV